MGPAGADDVATLEVDVVVLEVGLAVVLETGLVVVLDTSLLVEDARVDDAAPVVEAELIVDVMLVPPDGQVCTGPPGTTYGFPPLSYWQRPLEPTGQILM
jgi:hypothetical protein